MAKFDGTRFTKAAAPSGGTANLSNRIIGANPRKAKLTEAAGTNPSKLGGGKLSATTGGPNTSYAQDTAPHKTLAGGFSVGGPGFDDIQLKGFK